MEDSEINHSNGAFLSPNFHFTDLEKRDSLDLGYNGIRKIRKLNNAIKHETSDD